MATPQTMKAIKTPAQGKIEVQTVPVPQLRDDYILVKVKYVALNPTDWKHIDMIPTPNATVGCDYMGTVVSCGPNVRGDWQPGDRMAGNVLGTNKLDTTDGAFAEYAMVREGVAMKVPDNLSDAEAATLGVALCIVGLTLYQSLSLPWPGSVPADCWLLIYGGSTATASIAIQFAKLSGAKVITTSSKKNRDFVKSLGADEVFDYHDPDCGKKIREYTNDELCFVLDCFGGPGAAAICAQSISSRGGKITSITPWTQYPRTEDVRREAMLSYKMVGEPWDFQGGHEATVEDYEFGKMFWRLAAKLLAEGKVKVHPPTVREGLEGVIDGLDEMRKGLVSATKLVYKI